MVRPPLHRLSVVAVGILAAAALACTGRPAANAPRASVEHQDATLDARLSALDAALDRVEGRLLASQASVSLWEELRTRHERVAAVTCSNLSAHANAIAAYQHKERDQRAARSKNRLASRTVGAPTALR